MTMDPIEQQLREILMDFDEFSNDLIQGRIVQFAPPFDAYLSHTGDIISYLHDFFHTYVDRVNAMQCLDAVNSTMKSIVEKYRHDNNITNALAVSFDLLAETRSVCNMILDCLSRYFKGFPADAFEEMEKAMTDKGCHLLNLLPQIHYEKGSPDLYRVRKDVHDNALNLFHVPFEMRQKCDTYRFSIAGVPALYCGATLKTAMLETNISLGDEFSAAIFSYKKDYLSAFVDLTIPKRKDYGFWERYSLILFYPLIVACGLKVKDPSAPFKPEYVIPQLFYQLLRNHSSGFDGIIFNSSKYRVRDFADHRQSNYVIFTRQCDAESGYCTELANKLTVKGPKSFKYDSEEDIVAAADSLRSSDSGTVATVA